MRRIPLKIFIAALTFMIGVGFASAWLHIRHRPLSLCSLSENPASYDGKIVRVRGELYVSPNGMVQLNGIECGLRSTGWADVKFKNSPQIADELRRLNEGDNVAKAEVVLSGKFEDRKRSCWTAQFEIGDADLERAAQISIVNFLEEIKKEDARNGR
ncbi:MAG: hypothetical protein LC800_01700 [Acidobacteria bacterium]|nr:hypothetical protein [Acidobacteriota bacterium]